MKRWGSPLDDPKAFGDMSRWYPDTDWSYVEPDDSFTGEVTRNVAWWLSVTLTTLAAVAVALVLVLLARRLR